MATTAIQPPKIEFPTFTAKQEEIWDYLCDSEDGHLTVVGWGGSYGGGKTGGLVRFAITLMGMYPGIRVLIARNTLQNLKTPGGTIDQFIAALPMAGASIKEGGIVSSNLTDNKPILGIRLPGWPEGIESKVYFRGADDDTFFKSAEIGAFLAEEADGLKEESWTYGISRLRQRLPDGTFPKYFALAVANPSISWFKDWFIDNIEEKEARFEGAGRIKFYRSRQEDNPFLSENYEAMLRATLDDEEIQANIDGSFGSFAGKVYTNFSPEIHGVHQQDTRRGAEIVHGLTTWSPQSTKTIIIHGERLVIPRFKYAVGGLDFGGAQKKAHYTTGAVAVVTESGRDFLIDTFFDNGPGVHSRQVRWMREMEQALGMQINWAADGTQSAFITIMTNDYGFHILKNTGSNEAWSQDVEYNRSRFMIQQDGWPLSMYLDTPRNREWVKQIQQYRVEMKPGPNGVMRNVPIRKDDDLYDAYRYMHERLQALQRQENPGKKPQIPNEKQPKIGKVAPLSEFDKFIIENRERIKRERAAEMARIARQNLSVPA